MDDDKEHKAFKKKHFLFVGTDQKPQACWPIPQAYYRHYSPIVQQQSFQTHGFDYNEEEN